MDHPFDELSRKKNLTKHESLLLTAIVCLSTEGKFRGMTFSQVWNYLIELARQINLPVQSSLSHTVENRSFPLKQEINQKRVIDRKSQAAGERDDDTACSRKKK